MCEYFFSSFRGLFCFPALSPAVLRVVYLKFQQGQNTLQILQHHDGRKDHDWHIACVDAEC